MCFNGKVRFVRFQTEWQIGLKATFLDTEWKRVPFTYGVQPYENDIEKPENLDQMINLAETLASGFPFVRVDLFRLNDGTIKFGEMLFAPEGLIWNWDPPEYDKILGDLIKLPIDKK